VCSFSTFAYATLILNSRRFCINRHWSNSMTITRQASGLTVSEIENCRRFATLTTKTAHAIMLNRHCNMGRPWTRQDLGINNRTNGTNRTPANSLSYTRPTRQHATTCQTTGVDKSSSDRPAADCITTRPPPSQSSMCAFATRCLARARPATTWRTHGPIVCRVGASAD